MKNKKILGALAALCMGVILCVSSVFAINYWYRIDNNTNDNKVTTGHSLALSLADAAATEDNLYPGGIVDFGAVEVDGADAWGIPTANVVNTRLPKFALRIASVVVDGANQDFNEQFKLYTDKAQDGTFVAIGDFGDVATGLLLFDDLQSIGTNWSFDLRLEFNEDADVKYAEHSLTIVLEIVAYLDANDNGYEAGEVLVDTEVKDSEADGYDQTEAEDEDTLNPTGKGEKVDIDTVISND